MTSIDSNLLDFGSHIRENPNLAGELVLKSRFILNLRNALHAKNAIELEMPCLHKYREGAPVHQFVTEHPLTKERFYLRHCMEDHLRRSCTLHPRVYELGKAFRVENIDEHRANEFTVLEFVGKEMSYNDGIRLLIDVISEAANKTFSNEIINKWKLNNIKMVTFDDLMDDVLGFTSCHLNFKSKSIDKLKSKGVEIDSDALEWEIYEELLKHFLEPSLIMPSILTNFPKALQHVAEIDVKNNHALRFSIVINGIEVADGGVKLKTSHGYRKIYTANAAYRKNKLDIIDNELPEYFFNDLDEHDFSVFTFGFGVDRLFSICMERSIHEIRMFPYHT